MSIDLRREMLLQMGSGMLLPHLVPPLPDLQVQGLVQSQAVETPFGPAVRITLTLAGAALIEASDPAKNFPEGHFSSLGSSSTAREAHA